MANLSMRPLVGRHAPDEWALPASPPASPATNKKKKKKNPPVPFRPAARQERKKTLLHQKKKPASQVLRQMTRSEGVPRARQRFPQSILTTTSAPHMGLNLFGPQLGPCPPGTGKGWGGPPRPITPCLRARHHSLDFEMEGAPLQFRQRWHRVRF